jgi:hypothetical protein
MIVKGAGEPSGDAVGGSNGDILYFQITTNRIKRGDDDFPVHEMDWPRIQRGYQALTSRYGATRRTENELAFMAWKFQDAAVARQQFTLIGENWGRAVWRDRNYFDRARDWAQAPTAAPLPGQSDLSVEAVHLHHILAQRVTAGRTGIEHMSAGIFAHCYPAKVTHDRHLVHGKQGSHEGA